MIRYLEGTTEEQEEEAWVVVVKSSRKGKEREREREERPAKPAEPHVVPTHQMWVETSCGKPGQALTLASLVNSDVDDENDADGQEVNETPCKRCEKLKIRCLVQLEPKKLMSKDKRMVVRNRLACIGCRDSKNCFKLARKRLRSSPQPVSAPPWPDKEAKDTPAPPQGQACAKEENPSCSCRWSW